MADFITLQLANEEVDRLRAENKACTSRLHELAVHIQKVEDECEYLKSCLASEVARDYELECRSLRQTVTALKDENAHLRAMNRRVIEALAEQMPIGERWQESIEQKTMHCACKFEWRPMPDLSGAKPVLIEECGYHASARTLGEGGQNPVVTPTKPPAYKYPETFCSQCGGEFGPGNEGFSHCRNHAHLARLG